MKEWIFFSEYTQMFGLKKMICSSNPMSPTDSTQNSPRSLGGNIPPVLFPHNYYNDSVSHTFINHFRGSGAKL